MTIRDWIKLLEEILELLRRHSLAPPAAIRDLTVVARSNDMATKTLKWTDPTVDAKGNPLPAGALTDIEIFDEVGGASIGSVAAGVETFTTPDLPPGDYVFTVRTTDAAGNSAPSNAVSETIVVALDVPAAITDLTVS